MSKRSKFVLAAAILSGLLWASQFLVPESRIQGIIAIVVLSYILSAWVLFEDLKGIEWVTILVLPVLYTLGAGLFSLFLPTSVPRIWDRRLDTEVAQLLAAVMRAVFWIGFGVGFYAIYLTENIFSVAAIRTIQLIRAAHAVGFLLTLVVSLFLFNALFSFKLPFYAIAGLAGGLSLPLFLQGNWSMELKENLTPEVWRYSLGSALVIAQLSLSLSLWPARAITAALFLATGVYVLLGLSQQQLVGKLYKNQINEYVAIASVVLLASFLVTSWR